MPSLVTAMEIRQPRSPPSFAVCVAEPSEDTPGGASRLHLKRRGTTKEGSEGYEVEGRDGTQ